MSNSTRFVIVDNTNPNIQYVGPWFLDLSSFDNGDNGPSWNGTLQGVNLNASLAYNFTGTAVEVYGTFDRRSVRANGDIDPSWNCLVDGIAIRGTTLPFIGGTEHNKLLCGVNSLSDGLHTIALQATVTNSTSSFWFDDLHYLPSSSVSLENSTIIVDNTDPEIQFGEGWEPSISGGMQTVNPNTGLTLDFVGAQLTWFGMALANSSTALSTGASYSIDGAPPVPFLLPGALGPVTQLNQVIFQTGQLSPGLHRLKVTNSPTTPLTLQYLVIQNSTIPGTTPTGSSIVGPSGQSIPSTNSNSTAKSKFPTSAVAGGAVSGIIAIAAFGILIIFLQRRARRRNTVKHFPTSPVSTLHKDTPALKMSSVATSPTSIETPGRALGQIQVSKQPSLYLPKLKI